MIKSLFYLYLQHVEPGYRSIMRRFSNKTLKNFKQESGITARKLNAKKKEFSSTAEWCKQKFLNLFDGSCKGTIEILFNVVSLVTCAN